VTEGPSGRFAVAGRSDPAARAQAALVVVPGSLARRGAYLRDIEPTPELGIFASALLGSFAPVLTVRGGRLSIRAAFSGWGRGR